MILTNSNFFFNIINFNTTMGHCTHYKHDWFIFCIAPKIHQFIRMKGSTNLPTASG